ncbi:phage baseplate assembly protein [Rhizosaccharibacter radicis]|uniref:Phage tail protein n=1 Tax=Rhizosaccharibacter radicis TaxID=2782605 RepID=A0ABT1VWE7_9PROT|nr:phage tail protein [Acetobacteraceae bacterium KSS12]
MSGLLADAADVLGWGDVASDEVSIIVGGRRTTGWEAVSIRMSVEVMPWTFELETTEWAPDMAAEVTIQAGAPCEINIGPDRVLTGLVISVSRFGDANSHGVRVVGASRSFDLVNNSALFSTFQITGTDAVALANKVARPFGITAITVGEVDRTPIQQFDVILTETAYEIIERVCRYAALLVYDHTDGNIHLSRAGSTVAASGFELGRNVERFEATATVAERHSQISAVRQTTDTLFASPDAADLGGQMDLITAVGPVKDPTIQRYSPLIIPAEMADMGNEVTRRRVQWEINRRLGRSFAVSLTCDSWRDSAGALWAVNTLAPLNLSQAKVAPKAPWLIGEIVFRRDGEGTHADIVLMPREAYLPEPVLLNPLATEVGQAIREQQGAAPSLAGQDAAIAVDPEALPGLIR